VNEPAKMDDAPPRGVVRLQIGGLGDSACLHVVWYEPHITRRGVGMRNKTAFFYANDKSSSKHAPDANIH
jgi:hypothetical protein